MSRMLEFLAVIVRKMETLVLYFIERFSANFQALDRQFQIAIIVLFVLIILFSLYVFTIILRLDFKRRLRHLRNVRTTFYIDQLREQGKRCTIFHRILFAQKVVIIDEKVVQRVPYEVDVKKPKKLPKIRLSRKKDRLNDLSIPLLDPSDDVYVLDFIRLNRRMVISTFFIVLTFITIFFTKYHDFDVIFRGIYMLRYENYSLTDNLGSLLFVFAFLVSILMTLFIWIYFYTRGEWQDKINMRWVYDSYDIVSIIPTFIAIVTVVNTFFFSPATVTHTSMEPNYYEGDSIFLMHMAEYDRLDVVVILANEGTYNPDTDEYSMNDYYIKRIIGLPGDTVRIEAGEVYVNGIEIEDDEFLKPNMKTYCETGSNPDVDEVCTFVVPEGEYFLIGDNRTASLDSREIGTIEEERLYGVVVFRVG